MPHRLIVLAALAGLTFVVACSGELDPSLIEFEAGDCIRDPDFFVGVEELESLDRVDCSEPGVLRSMRVFDIIQYDDYPAEATIESLASSRCPFDSPLIIFPTRDSWNQAGDREVVCFE